MSGARTPAVPTGHTALRPPARPPIPTADEAARRPDTGASDQAGVEAEGLPGGPHDAERAAQMATQAVVRSTGEASAEEGPERASYPPTATAPEKPRQPRGRKAGQRAGGRAGRRAAQPGAVEPGDRLRRRVRVLRVQLNTKMDVDILDELRDYASDEDSTIQDVIEAAVVEYMENHPARQR